jgi:hypothetical protein
MFPAGNGCFCPGGIRPWGSFYRGVLGAGPHHVRSVAEALGKVTEASEYSPDMSKHYAFGSNPKLFEKYKQYIDDLIC